MEERLLKRRQWFGLALVVIAGAFLLLPKSAEFEGACAMFAGLIGMGGLQLMLSAPEGKDAGPN